MIGASQKVFCYNLISYRKKKKTKKKPFDKFNEIWDILRYSEFWPFGQTPVFQETDWKIIKSFHITV